MQHLEHPQERNEPHRVPRCSRRCSIVARCSAHAIRPGTPTRPPRRRLRQRSTGRRSRNEPSTPLSAQAAASGRPDTPETRKAIIDQLAMQMVVAEEAVKKGLDKSPEVTGTARRDEAVGARQRLRQGLPEEQSGDRRHAEGRIRPHQGDGQRQPVQGAPHPGGQGVRSQGHRRAAEERCRGVLEARDGSIEGPGLQAFGRRSRMVRSQPDGAGIRRRRDQAGKGQVHRGAGARRSSATT